MQDYRTIWAKRVCFTSHALMVCQGLRAEKRNTPTVYRSQRTLRPRLRKSRYGYKWLFNFQLAGSAVDAKVSHTGIRKADKHETRIPSKTTASTESGTPEELRQAGVTSMVLLIISCSTGTGCARAASLRPAMSRGIFSLRSWVRAEALSLTNLRGIQATRLTRPKSQNGLHLGEERAQALDSLLQLQGRVPLAVLSCCTLHLCCPENGKGTYDPFLLLQRLRRGLPHHCVPTTTASHD